jgi:capsular exopolysaccharide synthesis family protein
MDALKTTTPQETKLHFLDYWRIIRIRKTVILAVFLLVVITATVVTYFLPESYMSMARIKVERDQADITPLMQNQPMSSPYDPYFIQTEFEVLKSELILGTVIKDLGLREKWTKKYNVPLSKQETLELLQKSMDLRPVRNTSIIEIRYYSGDKKEAADIANAIADTYEKHRVEERRRLTGSGIDALTNRLDVVQAEVHRMQTNVDDLRLKLKITDPIGQMDTPTMMLTAESLREIEKIRIESKAELVRMQTLLNKLKELKPDDLAQAIPTTGINDQILTTLLEQETLADQRLITIRGAYGDKHPDLVAATAAAQDLKAKIKVRVDGFILGLDARVASLQESMINLEKEVEKAKQDDLDKARESRPYWEAKRTLDERQKFLQMLSFRISSERTDYDLPKSSMVTIVDTATEGLKPVRPNKTLNITLGVIIGLIVGVGLAFFIEYLDTSVKTIDDVERSLGAPVLGVIPQNVGILLDEGAESPHAEAYRVLRTNLLFSRKEDKLNTIAIVSAGAGEGKSTTVFNLAAVFAQSGQRVLMVDSDLRRPTLHKMLHVTNNIGLTNYLLKQNTLEEVIQTTNLPTLDFMASGKLPSSSLGILSSSQMRELITDLKQHYDFIFFDSPPVMGVSDASILASEVDMTLQVIQYRRYPQPMNIRAKQLIEKVGGNLVGIVLNNINMSQDESYYYYSGYYHDYYARNEDQEPAAAGDGGSGGKK